MPESYKQCIATTFLGKRCENEATIRDHCVLHAGGWDYTVANAAMLWSVYSRIQTVHGVVGSALTVFGPGARFMPSGKDASGFTRLNLNALRKRAEAILAELHGLIGREDAQAEIEKMGPTIIKLDKDFVQFVTLMAQSATSLRLVTAAELKELQQPKQPTKQKPEEQQKQS